MSYQVVKGWPSDGALDETLAPAPGAEIAGGSIVTLDASGDAVAADYAADGSNAGNLAFFVIDTDPFKGNILALKGQCIIECDADHYVADTYNIHDAVTAVGGKFAPVTASEKVVGRVINMDSATGKMRLVWSALA